VSKHRKIEPRCRILGRYWDKSLAEFSFLLFTIILPPIPPPPPEKVVWNWFGMRTLKIMPRNLNKIVRSWIRLQDFCNVCIGNHANLTL
jgi:hypothetical protein